MTSYNAASIKVLSAREIAESQPWVLAETLAEEYRQPVGFVRALLETCRLSGWPLDQAIARYLEGDRSIPLPPEVNAIYAEVSRRERQ